MEAVVDLLRASQAEQTPVVVYFRSGRLDGVVTRLDETTVELRGDRTRSVIRLSEIDAVTTG